MTAKLATVKPLDALFFVIPAGLTLAYWVATFAQ